MFWLFWFYYALAGFELVRALRRLSDGLELSVATFAALSFLAGLLVAAVLCAHSEGVGLLVWVRVETTCSVTHSRPIQTLQIAD